jgi:DNA-binding response OmpR family regulator
MLAAGARRDVEARSHAARPLTFTFVEQDATRVHTANNPAHRMTTPSPARVLVVEDEQDIANLIKRTLEGTADGQAIRLTRREFELLRFLVDNRNRVLSRGRLLERVWGYDRYIETRSVDVHVGRLRAKLGAAGPQIETVVGLGYRFVEH